MFSLPLSSIFMFVWATGLFSQQAPFNSHSLLFFLIERKDHEQKSSTVRFYENRTDKIGLSTSSDRALLDGTLKQILCLIFDVWALRKELLDVLTVGFGICCKLVTFLVSCSMAKAEFLIPAQESIDFFRVRCSGYHPSGHARGHFDPRNSQSQNIKNKFSSEKTTPTHTIPPTPPPPPTPHSHQHWGSSDHVSEQKRSGSSAWARRELGWMQPSFSHCKDFHKKIPHPSSPTEIWIRCQRFTRVFHNLCTSPWAFEWLSSEMTATDLDQCSPKIRETTFLSPLTQVLEFVSAAHAQHLH